MKFEATQEHVLRFLDLVKPVNMCIDGGWGVDALLGKQTRPHEDLDIIIADRDLPKIEDILKEGGFCRDTVEEGMVYACSSGLKVDIHPVEFDQHGYGYFKLPDGRRWPFPPSAFKGEGKIGNKRVMCLSPEAQVQCHAQGYTPTEKDLNDMNALQEKFEVVLPLTLCKHKAYKNA